MHFIATGTLAAVSGGVYGRIRSKKAELQPSLQDRRHGADYDSDKSFDYAFVYESTDKSGFEVASFYNRL